ncbi:glycine hydroxymethyltransferase [Treponema paraluiscuniculi Cuniculi A]|uniref:Serine hydroxymethyltransferase n=2 Tax=Treponema paraluiscuniculi TaxID=53435 RepID=F7XSE3_TREPU|nr:glycine hydroxymethyltransferase [Treponema paraluiscuniculi]AEH40271.1 glycine hydroxymethyltransferase [Treponema paraluiscuniculi Cuniculi A]WKC72199.1 glycine hydroxymethyltransferase [Treponema paraluiscuniculi]
MNNSALRAYLSTRAPDQIHSAFVAYLANLDLVAHQFPQIASDIVQELIDQRSYVKLIASENYSSLAVQAAMANLLTDKYAEGFPHHRYYGGCQNVDSIESAAAAEACALFGAEHAYVQPHSGADANLVAFWAILSRQIEIPTLSSLGVTAATHLSEEQWEVLRQKMGNQKLMGLDYFSGGHLTHGYRQNVSGRMFRVVSYAVDRDTGLLDYAAIEAQAKRERPLILLAGYSAYPRSINFRIFREIADKVGAVLMADMAHFAGLVAGGVFTGDEDPVRWSHIVTSTTHKTLRGPRGAFILCKKEFAEAVDKGCPLVLGGPLPHVMAAKAVAFREARHAAFKTYAHAVRDNARALADACIQQGMQLQTGGTDNHLLLLDVRPFGLTGRQAERALIDCGVTLNRNSLPFDPNGAWLTSGLRIGTPAVTSLGMGPEEMKRIARLIARVLGAATPVRTKTGALSKSAAEVPGEVRSSVCSEVRELLARFTLYPELDEPFLRAHFTRRPADKTPADEGT